MRVGEAPVPVQMRRAQDAAQAYRDAAPPRPARAVGDALSVLGIPERELTPAVRTALGGLMAEVKALQAERLAMADQLRLAQELADSDPLAPVLNRRAFVREMQRIMSFAERYDVAASVVYFDLNGFKQVNDRMGHKAGDAVLRTVADTLRANVRESDLVGRVGGDEFAVVLAKAGPDDARRKGAQLSAAIRQAVTEHDGQRLRVGAAFGTWTFTPGDTPERALSLADEAMFADKGGRKIQLL